MSLSLDSEREIYSVSRLNSEVRILLESAFGTLWVEGELSNIARPSSGHTYFTLKDAEAQVRCAMFRQRNVRLGFEPAEGMQVLVRGRVSLYQARGDYQLIVDHMEEAGAGALRRAFEELKQRLAAEGLFDAERKRALPVLPHRIGVITSPTGAAIRDILTTLRRRFAAIPVVLYPVPVQGEGAARQIAATLALADARGECEVLILARGGGSLEDLQAFNDEGVARAIAACATPVVVGVGHEIDFTIADFVADQRAATPTAAAELVSPNAADWLQTFRALEERLGLRMRRRLDERRQQLAGLSGRLARQHPGRRLQERAQRLDELEQRLRLAWRGSQRQAAAHLQQLVARLHRFDPRDRIATLQDRRNHLAHRLRMAMRRTLDEQQQRLEAIMRALDTVSPLATLERGYAIVVRQADQRIVRAWNEVAVGECVRARLRRGALVCRVEEQEPGDTP